MKCAKCGYTSFAYLERCSTCGQELAELRSAFGLYGLRATPLDLTARIGPEPDAVATAPASATAAPTTDSSQPDVIERVFDLEIEDDAESLTLASPAETSAVDHREPAGPVLEIADEIQLEMDEREREDDDSHR